MKNAVGTAKRILSTVVTVLLLCILVLAMVQRISGATPGIGGFHLMQILTGSMEPEIMTGDAVLVRECSAADVKIGDVICYKSRTGEMSGKMITHKVIEGPYEKDGETWLRTKGTANDVADDPIRAEQVYGIVVCRLTLIGKLYSFFCTVPGLIVIVLPIVLIMIGEIRSMIRVAREEVAEAAAEAKTEAVAMAAAEAKPEEKEQQKE